MNITNKQSKVKKKKQKNRQHFVVNILHFMRKIFYLSWTFIEVDINNSSLRLVAKRFVFKSYLNMK